MNAPMKPLSPCTTAVRLANVVRPRITTGVVVPGMLFFAESLCGVSVT